MAETNIEYFNYYFKMFTQSIIDIFPEYKTVLDDYYNDLLENEVCLGDRFRIGSAELIATQPREPCVTLNARIGLIDLSARFRKSGRSGFYFSVVKEGTLSSGDLIKSVSKDENRVSISEFNQVISGASGIKDIIQRASKVDALPQKLKNKLLKLKMH